VNGCVTEAEFLEYDMISHRMGVVINRVMPPPSTGRRLGLEQRFGMPLLEIRPVAFTRRQELIKRAFDIMVAALALIVASPLLLTVALMIKLTSKGPVCYSALRVGKGGRYFSFIKFRSMYVGRSRTDLAASNEKGGKLFKMKNDPRITPVGRFIRKYSLDELPQLINVLRGDMSLVGPRPLPAEDLDPDGQSREFAAWSDLRSRALPGISGLWQVKGRSDLSFEDMIELDTEYIRRWSLALDMRILLKTPVVVITGKGAY
jgi:exopolysaccharide biosynthesis polyprenyl glycosylphosphotransferase